MRYKIWYNSPFLFLTALSIFIFLVKFNTKIINKKTTDSFIFVSKHTLSIYFVHILIIMLLKPYVTALKIVLPLKVLLLFIVVTVFSFIIVKVFSLSKIIETHLFVIK